MKRFVVAGLDRADRVLDQLLYRPAVVKLTARLPRWWLCDLSKLSIRLDDRWSIGYWDAESLAPGPPCDACGRRASIFEVGGWAEGEAGADEEFMAKRTVALCGWCKLPTGSITSEGELQAAMREARERSVSWRWRWRASSELFTDRSR